MSKPANLTADYSDGVGMDILLFTFITYAESRNEETLPGFEH